MTLGEGESAVLSIDFNSSYFIFLKLRLPTLSLSEDIF